jgi:hypothetical protein
MSITVEKTELFLRNLTLRIPFRFGIVLMTHTPHLIMRLTARINGHTVRGYAADNLIPKWFTKDPHTAYRDEINDMFAVIEHAAQVVELVEAPTVFALWRHVRQAQEKWAREAAIPPLLAGFGVSLVERALIEAWCRHTGKPFGATVLDGDLGLQLGEVHPELKGRSAQEFLPAQLLRKITARHTVGLADALTADDFTADAPSPHDGLPAALDEIIRTYGLTHFKIKLSGDVQRDRARLRRIAEVIAREASACRFTLDGNENFQAVAPFRALWEGLHADPMLAHFLDGLIFVEQPFYRGVALSDALTAELLAWKERPPIIIDESDAELDSLPRALAGGYAGTSHKNCKGIFHGLASACLIAHRQAQQPDRPLHLSAEDLTNLGPIAVQQDLAVAAALGITHAERNGHHYFAGLSQFPATIQKAALQHHGDFYTRHRDGFPTVSVKSGVIDIGSVVDAPFGVGYEPDLEGFIPRADWCFESMQVCAAG